MQYLKLHRHLGDGKPPADGLRQKAWDDAVAPSVHVCVRDMCMCASVGISYRPVFGRGYLLLEASSLGGRPEIVIS